MEVLWRLIKQVALLLYNLAQERLNEVPEIPEHTYKPTEDIPSPSDIVPQVNISKVDNKIEVILDNLSIPFTKPPKVRLTTVADTNSMDPVVDYLHTCLLIAGADSDEHKVLIESLTVGNAIVYEINQRLILHRIVEIGEDERGRRFKLKGDNNFRKDPYVVRDIHIKWLLAGVIY